MKYLDTFIKSAGSWMIAGGLFQAISGFGANVVLARNLEVQDFVLTVGDAHIYNTHYDAVNEQLQRTPQELPTLNIVKDFSSLEEALDLVVSDFQLDNYNPLSAIKAEMAI